VVRLHGNACVIFQVEGVLAVKLHRGGTPIVDVQKQVNERFCHSHASHRKYEFVQALLSNTFVEKWR
jgi:hypothetical protein